MDIEKIMKHYAVEYLWEEAYRIGKIAAAGPTEFNTRRWQRACERAQRVMDETIAGPLLYIALADAYNKDN